MHSLRPLHTHEITSVDVLDKCTVIVFYMMSRCIFLKTSKPPSPGEKGIFHKWGLRQSFHGVCVQCVCLVRTSNC